VQVYELGWVKKGEETNQKLPNNISRASVFFLASTH
jgi:hypothetical protein